MEHDQVSLCGQRPLGAPQAWDEFRFAPRRLTLTSTIEAARGTYFLLAARGAYFWLPLGLLIAVPTPSDPRSGDRAHHAAIHSQRGARCGRCSLTAKIDHKIGNLLGRRHAFDTETWACSVLITSVSASFTSIPRSLAIFSRNSITPSERVGPGSTRVHRDPRSGHALGNTARDGELRRLGHAVMHHLGRNIQPQLTRDENDAAQSLLDHVW